MPFRRKKDKDEDLLDKKIAETDFIKDTLIEEGVIKLDEKLNSEDYSIDGIIENSHLRDKYHNLIDSEDQMDSELELNVNRSFHKVDVELYELSDKAKTSEKLEDHLKRNSYKKIEERVNSLLDDED